MANFGRVKTWGNETLQAADLNAEFDNVINNVTSGSVSSANIDLTDGYAWTGAHTFSVDMKVLNGAGVIVGNTAQVTTSSAGEFQVLGTAAADSTAIIGHWAAAATGGKLSFVKSRNATIGSSTIVADNDVLGTIEFMADDGSDFATPAASIFSRINGTPGANDMPGELVLAVTADAGNAVTERVRILQSGTVELNSGTLSFDGAASIDTSGNAILSLSAGTADIQVTASNLTPASNDGSALGVSGTAWSDLFLASGSVVNWVAGDITLTHSAGKLTFGGDGAVEIDFNNHEMTNVDINSGAIDGAIIGAASAAAGSFAAIVGTSLDVNGAADISGDLTLSAGADGALTFANAGENSIKIPDNQASALIIEEADAAYLTFVTTNSGEKITLGKKLEAGSVEIEGSGFDINGGAIDGAIIGAASAAAGTFTALTATSFDLAATGNRIDFDTANTASIRATAATQLDFEVSGIDALELIGSGSAHTYLRVKSPAASDDRGAYMDLKIPASGSGSMEYSWTQGAGNGDANNKKYAMGYSPGSTQLYLYSQDIDGSSTGGWVWKIQDGQTTIDANTTWDENVFDFVCDGCGRHQETMFECCDKVRWHDDTALMVDLVHAPSRLRAVRQLHKMGIVSEYTEKPDGSIEAFQSIQKSNQFTWSAMAQLHKKLGNIEAEVDKLRKVK